jgi:hypothetical protein
VQTIWTKTKADFTRVLLAGATIWPPAQMVNFFFVPLPYRVLFMNMVGFGWSTYTSLVASQAFYHPHLAKSEDRRRRYYITLYYHIIILLYITFLYIIWIILSYYVYYVLFDLSRA